MAKYLALVYKLIKAMLSAGFTPRELNDFSENLPRLVLIHEVMLGRATIVVKKGGKD